MSTQSGCVLEFNVPKIITCRHQHTSRMNESILYPSDKQFELQAAVDVGRKLFPLSSPHSNTLCVYMDLGGKEREDFGRMFSSKIRSTWWKGSPVSRAWQNSLGSSLTLWSGNPLTPTWLRTFFYWRENKIASQCQDFFPLGSYILQCKYWPQLISLI